MKGNNGYGCDVSIIIVNYHTQRLIADCLESVLRLTKDVAYEVIIVDNASGPGYKEPIENVAPGFCRYVDLKENIGFGRANNEGFRIAEGRNLLCLNPDTVLLNNAVKILSDYLDSHPKAGAVGGNLYDGDMRPALSYRRIFPGVWWEFNELIGFLPEKMIYGGNRVYNTTKKPICVKYITGADLMIKRGVLDRSGGFSSDFFMYYEETDLCRRISRMGYDVVSVPEARIQHLEGKSFGDTLQKGRLERIETGREIYIRRNCGRLGGAISDLLHYLLLKSRAVLARSESCGYRLEVFEKLR